MDEGSSSNSSSSASSSSSLSSSGSSSSGSDSSSGEEKSVKDKTPPTNMSTRRKSVEIKVFEKPVPIASVLANNKRNTVNSSIANSVLNSKTSKNNGASSDEEQSSQKRINKTNLPASQKRKFSATSAPTPTVFASVTPKSQAPQVHQQVSVSMSSDKPVVNPKPSPGLSKLKCRSLKFIEDDSEKERKSSTSASTPITINGSGIQAKVTIETKQSATSAANKKAAVKNSMRLSTINPAIAANKPKLPRKKHTETTSKSISVSVKKGSVSKSSDDSDSESDSDSDEESTSSTETEGTASSNSYSSNVAKTVKNKRTPVKNNKPTHSDSEEDETTPRKLTRSFSNRVNKQLKKEISHTDSTTEGEDEKNVKTATRRSNVTNGITTKNKCKKESNSISGKICLTQPRMMSPPTLIEKKCPIEGCDSSGHLSGNLERHFLPDACPIYHNMSASECKERANERRIRNEYRNKLEKTFLGNNSNSNGPTRPLTADQKEILSKIQESRANFKPTANSSNEKVKLEKDYTDEDREPNLNGFVPEYDLQLFREAQAIASQKIENEIKDLPVGKGIKYITMGKYKMKVWYQSPYPDDAARLPQMYICEFCLRYQKSETSIKRHAQKCVWRHPPGDEIYRKGKLQVWQVDGKRQKQYCQHLCLLAKFFLDHKTLYYDVEPFLFYIMTLADVDGCHTVGYFSKEKNSFYNVSCILTLPPYQRKGYGRLLIDFSYLLTRVEGKIGSPEKPLSDLGLISYRSYWKDVLLDFLCNRSGSTLSIKDVSQEMAIYSYDIVSTLQALGMMKYWKGKHIVLKKQDVLDEYAERVKRRGTFPKIDETCLRWNPFVPTQNNDST